MADPEDPSNPFPDVSHKLSAPKKLSQFEKERQAAQAKEKRAEAENAAALKAFQDSFADGGEDDDYDGFPASARGRGRDEGLGRGFGGRYGDQRGGMGSGMSSGPGSLGPPPNLKRKRALDEMREMQEVRRGQNVGFGGNEYARDSRELAPRAEIREEEEEVDDAPRPTIQLSGLPPSSTEGDVRALLSGFVDVHSVKLMPSADPRYQAAKMSLSAIATLASDVSTSQIDTAVTALKEKYLGSGFYLSISRHLSSAAMHPSVAAQASITAPSTEPFGAEKPRDRYNNPRGGFSMRNAPPPMEHQNPRFAPPDSYDTPYNRGSSPGRRNLPPPEAIVHPHPPPSLAQIQAIHTLVDRLLLEPSPARALQMESLLLSLPEVQSDERFAFLYDAKSVAGVYYRYLLWSSAEEGEEEEVREMKRRVKGQERIFEDAPLDWDGRGASVPFPSLRELKEVVTDVDYISSDEEEDDEDEGAAADGEGGPEGRRRFGFLTPLKKARLVHLLSRMPTSNAKLRKGDIARVTNFAINHAGAGAEEIVDLLLLNVEMPFSYSLASRYEDDSSEHEQDEDDIYEPIDDLSNLDSPVPQVQKLDTKRDVADDPSNSKLIALYTISDILSASSTAGARNAWKYRALFEHGFREQKTFANLGRVEREAGWGKMRAEQWKRRIGTLLGLWEGWAVFPNEVLGELRGAFFGAVEAVREGGEGREQEGGVEGEKKEGWMSKFKRVGETQSPAPTPAAGVDDVDGRPMDEDVDGKPMDDEDIDGRPMEEDVDGIPMDDIDGAPMEDVDGAPMADSDEAEDQKAMMKKVEPEVEAKVDSSVSTSTSKLSSKQPPGPRRRMRAEDMFADSDEE